MEAMQELGGVPIGAGQSAGHNVFVLGNIVAGGYYERAERPFGLSLTQWTVLRSVLITPAQSQADIASACGLNAMNVSRAVAALRQKGLVEATSDPNNQRRKMLASTELGESIGNDLGERERLLYDHVFSDLSEQEVEHLDGLVERVIERLSAHPPPEPPAPSRDWRALFDAQESGSSTKPHQQKSGATA